MGNKNEESNENKIPIKFVCNYDEELEKKIFYFDPDSTISQMINKFNKITKFERKHRNLIFGPYYQYIYKGFPLMPRSQELLRDVFNEDDNIKIIINVDYGCSIF
jgi:hypothetical protein